MKMKRFKQVLGVMNARNSLSVSSTLEDREPLLLVESGVLLFTPIPNFLFSVFFYFFFFFFFYFFFFFFFYCFFIYLFLFFFFFFFSFWSQKILHVVVCDDHYTSARSESHHTRSKPFV